MLFNHWRMNGATQENGTRVIGNCAVSENNMEGHWKFSGGWGI